MQQPQLGRCLSLFACHPSRDLHLATNTSWQGDTACHSNRPSLERYCGKARCAKRYHSGSLWKFHSQKLCAKSLRVHFCKLNTIQRWQESSWKQAPMEQGLILVCSRNSVKAILCATHPVYRQSASFGDTNALPEFSKLWIGQHQDHFSLALWAFVSLHRWRLKADDASRLWPGGRESKLIRVRVTSAPFALRPSEIRNNYNSD
jgi:hypothetical protein